MAIFLWIKQGKWGNDESSLWCSIVGNFCSHYRIAEKKFLTKMEQSERAVKPPPHAPRVQAPWHPVLWQLLKNHYLSTKHLLMSARTCQLSSLFLSKKKNNTIELSSELVIIKLSFLTTTDFLLPVAMEDIYTQANNLNFNQPIGKKIK